MSDYRERTIILRENLIKEYPSKYVHADILNEYRLPETQIIVNDDDRDSYPIPLDLPTPPPYHLVNGFGLPRKEQYFRLPVIPEKITKLLKTKGRGASIIDIWGELERNKVYYKSEILWIKLQWFYRMNGYWFFNNGIPTYIDGWHWFFLSWWNLDSGMPEYRYRDRIFFLFARYCYTTTTAPFFYRIFYDDEYKYFANKQQAEKFIQDMGLLLQPERGNFIHDFGFRTCFGFNYPKHRREGATYKGAMINYEIISRTVSAIGGIQSRDEKAAKEDVYEKKILNPFKRVPFFFKPIHKNSFANALVFDETSSVASNGGFVSSNMGLESEITYRAASERAFDGTKMWFYHGDEIGKPGGKPYNSIERWEVVYKTLSQGTDIHGLAIHTSTVSDTAGDAGRNYMYLCKYSKYEERSNVSGLTQSGLLNLFISSLINLEGLSDRYGNPIIRKPNAEQKAYTKKNFGSEEYLSNKLSEKANDPISYYETMREFPTKFRHCFLSAGKESGFNLKVLSDRMAELDMDSNSQVRIGNFKWEDKFGGNVKFVDDVDGKFYISYIPATPNAFITKNNKKCPANVSQFVSSADPFKFENVKYGKKSKGGGSVFIKHDKLIDPETKDVREYITKRCVCTYSNRVDKKDVYKEDMLMMCIFFGTKIFPENNDNAIYEYFTLHGFDEYLQYRYVDGIPDPNPGFPSSEEMKQRMFALIMDYIENHGMAERHRELLQEIYDIRGLKDMTNYDLFTAFGGCLLAIYYEDQAKPKRKYEDGEVDPLIKYLSGTY